jgi:hypothetical protein
MKEVNMIKSSLVLVPVLSILFLCGALFGSDSKKVEDFHILKITGTGDVVIDADNKIAKPKMKFDLFKPGEIEIPVARIIITQTTPTYSIGTIVNKMDGSLPKPSDISMGMICRMTTKETLKAEKKIYKYQKKALKRQYKLTKLKVKSGVYESLDKIDKDANGVSSIKAGFIKVEKK